MTELCDFLMTNYYAKYKGNRLDIVTTPEILEQALEICQDKVVVVKDEAIKGVAIYLTLSDETYEKLGKLDISSIDVLSELLKEHGDNLHFVLLAADGFKTIMVGLRDIRKKSKPKTISWWEPNMTILHKYNLN